MYVYIYIYINTYISYIYIYIDTHIQLPIIIVATRAIPDAHPLRGAPPGRTGWADT